MPLIFTTKLYIPPPRKKAVARARLYHKLLEGLSRPLTLVSAPAGFGKSTLISEWYEQSGGAFQRAWISLDTEDNDPERFLAYLAAACDRLQAGSGEALLAVLDAPQRPGPRAALGLLIRDLMGFVGTGVLLLDDYHTIINPEIHDLVAYLIGNLPPGLHLIIATRADPPLPLGRLRVNDRLVEIRAADLLLQRDEVETFLSETMGLKISREAAARLAERTEGWAAGLQLAALAAGSEGSAVLELGFGGDHPYLLDYLMEEVLAHLPPETQYFLMHTALLEELCGPLCDAVLERQDSAQVLESLNRANLFLISLGSDAQARQWFRYHHLFAESLNARLKQMEAVLIPKLIGRAAHWFAGEGRMEDAIRFALAGGEIEQAVQWIESEALQYLKHGRATPVLRWLTALPENWLHRRSGLAMIWARTLFMTGDFARAREELDALEQRFLYASSPESQAMLGEVYAMRATIESMRGDWASTITDAQKGLDLLPAGSFNWRALAALNLGNAYMISGDYLAADEAFNNAIRDGLPADNLHVVFTAISNQSETRVIRGDLRAGEAALLQGLQIIREQAALVHPVAGGEPKRVRLIPTASLVYCSLGELSIERHDLAAAEVYIQQAVTLSEQGGFVVAVFSALAAQAHLEWARGEPQKGLAWVEQAAKTVQGPQAHALLGLLQALRVRLQLAMGDLAPVEQWAAGIHFEPDEAFDYLHELEVMLLVRLLRMQGQAERGLEAALHMLAIAEAGQRLGRALETRLQVALLYHQLGDHPAALAALREELEFADSQGYCGVFLEAGKEMRPLMQSLFRDLPVDNPLRAAARRILEAFPSGEHGAMNANRLLIEPLSERELEVLRMVAQGASNQTIADRLIVSLGTVKSHVHHIQGKLGTRSRVALVQRAKDSGLI